MLFETNGTNLFSPILTCCRAKMFDRRVAPRPSHTSTTSVTPPSSPAVRTTPQSRSKSSRWHCITFFVFVSTGGREGGSLWVSTAIFLHAEWSVRLIGGAPEGRARPPVTSSAAVGLLGRRLVAHAGVVGESCARRSGRLCFSNVGVKRERRESLK